MMLPDAQLLLQENFLTTAEADRLFAELRQHINWQQDNVRVFGKIHPQPRLTAFHGDKNLSLSYSGLTMTSNPWTEALLQVKNRIEECFEASYNCVLLNLYRDGRDSNGWHADNEAYLGRNPVIASVSLGAPRMFHLRHNQLELPVQKIELTHGSLLIMAGTTQHFWKHQIPKTARPVGERINLTFRRIVT
mgnify:CR=1 FL=1